MLIALVWVAANLVTLGFAAFGIFDGVADVIAAKSVARDDLCISARGYLRAQTVRFAEAAMFVSVAVIAVVTGVTSTPVSSSTQFVRRLVIIPVVLVACGAVSDWLTRRKLRTLHR